MGHVRTGSPIPGSEGSKFVYGLLYSLQVPHHQSVSSGLPSETARLPCAEPQVVPRANDRMDAVQSFLAAEIELEKEDPSQIKAKTGFELLGLT
jgi:hypothetical protein